MMAAGERSRMSWHSSNPSTSGSIRSSRTMSGSSVSSRFSAPSPSSESTGSKPRMARFDRIRLTMLGSSSTTRARVVDAGSTIGDGLQRRGARRGESGVLHWQPDAEPGTAWWLVQLDPAAVRGDDGTGDGQAEAGPGPR